MRFRLILIPILVLIAAMPVSALDQVQLPLNDIALNSLEKIDPPEEGFSFVVWGDCRNDDGRFDDVMAKVNELDPLFSVGLGDFVFGGTSMEWDVFIPRLDAFKQPMISVPGNHDYFAGAKGLWLEKFGKTNFVFDFGGVRFVGVDNADYVIDEKDIQFLRENLDTDMPKILFAHCPPDVDRWKVHSFKKGSDELLKILDEYDVDYAFFAHIHLYDEMMLGNTQGVVTGGAGAPIYSKFGFGGPNTHVVEVFVTPDGITHRKVNVY